MEGKLKFLEDNLGKGILVKIKSGSIKAELVGIVEKRQDFIILFKKVTAVLTKGEVFWSSGKIMNITKKGKVEFCWNEDSMAGVFHKNKIDIGLKLRDLEFSKFEQDVSKSHKR